MEHLFKMSDVVHIWLANQNEEDSCNVHPLIVQTDNHILFDLKTLYIDCFCKTYLSSTICRSDINKLNFISGKKLLNKLINKIYVSTIGTRKSDTCVDAIFTIN